MLKRPTLIDAWLADLLDDYRRYGVRKLFPTLLLSSFAFGAAVTLLVPEDNFWSKPEVSAVFFTAALTVNGLLLALSWASFAKIYEIAAQPAISAYLKRKDLLRDYIFQIDFIHCTQVFALACSGVGLILSTISHLPSFVETIIPLIVLQKIALAASVGASIYALRYALGAVRIMQDLVWYSAHIPDASDREMKVHEGGRS